MRHSEKQNYNEDPGARRTGQQARKRRQGPETQAKDEPESGCQVERKNKDQDELKLVSSKDSTMFYV